jgi:hypothetical protein
MNETDEPGDRLGTCSRHSLSLALSGFKVLKQTRHDQGYITHVWTVTSHDA